LARLIDGVSEENSSANRAPKKWSVLEILANLAEDELTSS
jgi:hypothetical protein